MHRLLVDGVTVEYRRNDGSIAGAQARVLDFDTVANNDWVAVNQFTVSEGQHTRRPDVVLFVNGLPLAIIELKNAADPNADVWKAFDQLQTYQAEILALFSHNVALIASDGTTARIGGLGGGRPPHAGCLAASFVHRLHGHADRENRRQHPRRVWGLYQRL
jgi:type I restriction enzyme, R subunit